MRSAAWITFHDAMDLGWQATARLAVLMLVRYGVPIYGVVHLGGILLTRLH